MVILYLLLFIAFCFAKDTDNAVKKSDEFNPKKILGNIGNDLKLIDKILKKLPTKHYLETMTYTGTTTEDTICFCGDNYYHVGECHDLINYVYMCCLGGWRTCEKKYRDVCCI